MILEDHSDDIKQLMGLMMEVKGYVSKREVTPSTYVAKGSGLYWYMLRDLSKEKQLMSEGEGFRIPTHCGKAPCARETSEMPPALHGNREVI